MAIFQLKVNGNLHTVDVDGNMPLLWAIRDVLGLKGTKFGCGVAQCGACTVHMDGKAIRSCAVDVSVAALSRITTIEGLKSAATLTSTAQERMALPSMWTVQ